MKRTAKIVSIGETRTGRSDKTGEPWFRTDIVIKWTEEEPPYPPYACQLVVTLCYQPDMEKIREAMDRQTDLLVTFYPATHEYNGRTFNSINAYLPAEYKKQQEERP